MAPERGVNVQYTIRDRDGAEVVTEGTNWLTAFAKAVEQLQVDLRHETRLVCTRHVDGGVTVDGRVAQQWTVSPAQPDIEVRPSSRSKVEEIELPPVEIPTAELGRAVDKLQMPTSSLAIEAPVPLAERLFDITADLETASTDEAAAMALDLLMEYVHADAGSVVRGTLNDPCLTFIVARGPVADQIVGRKVAFGEGLVGMCFDLRSTVVVDDVDQETRHLDQFDKSTGFNTVAAWCVPILDESQGLMYGVIQLLNPHGRGFTMADKDAAEATARALASVMAQAL